MVPHTPTFSEKQSIFCISCILKGVAALHEQEIWLTNKLNPYKILIGNKKFKVNYSAIDKIFDKPHYDYRRNHMHNNTNVFYASP